MQQNSFNLELNRKKHVLQNMARIPWCSSNWHVEYGEQENKVKLKSNRTHASKQKGSDRSNTFTAINPIAIGECCLRLGIIQVWFFFFALDIESLDVYSWFSTHMVLLYGALFAQLVWFLNTSKLQSQSQRLVRLAYAYHSTVFGLGRIWLQHT